MATEEIAQTKSPKSPRTTLAEAIESVKKLYAEAKRSSIKRDIAAKVLGYTSLNGSALTKLSTLIQYGLLDQGVGSVAVSQLAMQIMHPLSEPQRIDALRKAALSPKVFSDIHSGHHGVSESVLAAHLTQGRFPHDVARILARYYLENAKLAKLDDTLQSGNNECESSSSVTSSSSSSTLPDEDENTISSDQGQSDDGHAERQKKQRVLANYSIPLGANEATLTFTGDILTPDDFEALSEFVGFAKKQFERKLKAQQASNLAQTLTLLNPPRKESSNEV